jgi:O-antigen/teichoic acid export membrane protein
VTTTVHSPATSRGILHGAGVLTAAVAVQGAANLVFHAVVSRRLGPEAYGTLGVLLALVLLLTVPLGSV